MTSEKDVSEEQAAHYGRLFTIFLRFWFSNNPKKILPSHNAEKINSIDTTALRNETNINSFRDKLFTLLGSMYSIVDLEKLGEGFIAYIASTSPLLKEAALSAGVLFRQTRSLKNQPPLPVSPQSPEMIAQRDLLMITGPTAAPEPEPGPAPAPEPELGLADLFTNFTPVSPSDSETNDSDISREEVTTAVLVHEGIVLRVDNAKTKAESGSTDLPPTVLISGDPTAAKLSLRSSTPIPTDSGSTAPAPIIPTNSDSTTPAPISTHSAANPSAPKTAPATGKSWSAVLKKPLIGAAVLGGSSFLLAFFLIAEPIGWSLFCTTVLGASLGALGGLLFNSFWGQKKTSPKSNKAKESKQASTTVPLVPDRVEPILLSKARGAEEPATGAAAEKTPQRPAPQ